VYGCDRRGGGNRDAREYKHTSERVNGGEKERKRGRAREKDRSRERGV